MMSHLAVQPLFDAFQDGPSIPPPGQSGNPKKAPPAATGYARPTIIPISWAAAAARSQLVDQVCLDFVLAYDKFVEISIPLKTPLTKTVKSSRAAEAGGFTLLELLVVIGVIAVLAAIKIPVLSRTKTNALGISCLSNMKQLQLGALLYSYNNNNYLPANVSLRSGGDSTSGRPNWVDGVFSSGNNGGLSENPTGCATNPFYLGVQELTGGYPGVTLIGSIGPYVRVAGVYHCPADKYLDPNWHMPRVRSCSMNAWTDGSGLGGGGGGSYKVFKKISDFGGKLAASDCFVFLDENPISLNDGWFLYVVAGNPPTVNDRPAVNHGRYTSFSFADGHAEPHEWHDVFLQSLTPGSQGGTDTVWLSQHGTYQ